MADREYMTSQSYDATLGGIAYNVTVNLSAVPTALPSGWFNVKAYGATGDGLADDRAAIQAACVACDTAGGGVVFLPYGTYRIVYSGGVGISFSGMSGVTMTGDGATIKTADSQCVASTAYYMILSNASTTGLTIRDIRLDGNGDNNTVFTVADVLTLIGDNIKIENVDIVNPSDSGIMFSATNDSSITNCYIDGGSVGSGASPYTAWSSGANTDLGIYVNDGRAGAGAAGSAEIGYDSASEMLTGGIITGNKIRRFRNGGIGLKRVSANVVVSDNNIRDCGNGVTCENASYTGDSSLKNTICGNQIYDIGWINNAAAGRGLNLRFSHYSVMNSNYVENCTGESVIIEGTQRSSVCGNTIVGAGTVKGTTQHGIFVIARPDGVPANVYSTDNTIVGNTVSGHHRSGIIMDSVFYTNLNVDNKIELNSVVGNGVTSGSNYVNSGSSVLHYSAKTAAFDLEASDSGGVFTNDGAGGSITFNLPAATVGLNYFFSDQAAQAIFLNPDGTETIKYRGTTGAGGGTLESTVSYTSCHLVASGTGTWVVVSDEAVIGWSL